MRDKVSRKTHEEKDYGLSKDDDYIGHDKRDEEIGIRDKSFNHGKGELNGA